MERNDKSNANNNDKQAVSGTERELSDSNSASTYKASLRRFLSLSLPIIFVSTLL